MTTTPPGRDQRDAANPRVGDARTPVRRLAPPLAYPRAAHGRAARRRVVAVLATIALALTGLIAATGAAHAEPRLVDDGALAWGFKESFRNYVARQIAALPPIGPAPEGERVTVGEGARFDPDGTPTFPASSSDPNESLPYLFEVTGGSVTDAQNLVVRTRGAVTYTFPSHHFELTISNLAVVVERGTARLVGDVYQLATEDFGGFEKGEYEVRGGTIGTVGTVDATIDGDTVTVRGTGLQVHADAATALPQGEGEALDSFTLTASLGEIEDPSPTPTPTPTPTPEPGELSWRIDGSSRVSLGTASVTDGHFLATATLPPVVVTDSRAGGPAWRVTAQVSDFSNDDGVLRARHLGWVPAVLSAGGGAVAGETVAPRLVTGKGQGLGVPRTLGSAPGGHPAGTATLGGTLELRAPLGTAPGAYRAVLTITAVS